MEVLRVPVAGYREAEFDPAVGAEAPDCDFGVSMMEFRKVESSVKNNQLMCPARHYMCRFYLKC